MAAVGLSEFMQAIGTLESGNNYNAIGPNTGSRYGRARGRYQIMETIWPGWAKEAGIPGADWKDPKAQDRVARFKMSQYYQQFGSWDLVAVAWFAGPGRAQKAKEQGIESVGGLQDIIGTSVSRYVERTLELMGNPRVESSVTSPHESDVLTPSRQAAEAEARGVEPKGQQAAAPKVSGGEVLAQIMAAISRAAMASGGRVLNTDALFGGFGKEARDGS